MGLITASSWPFANLPGSWVTVRWWTMDMFGVWTLFSSGRSGRELHAMCMNDIKWGRHQSFKHPPSGRVDGRTCIMPMGPFFFFHPSSYFLTYLLSPFDPFFSLLSLFPPAWPSDSHVPWFAVRLHFKWFLDRPIAGLVMATRFIIITHPSITRAGHPPTHYYCRVSVWNCPLSTCLIVDPPGLMSGQWGKQQWQWRMMVTMISQGVALDYRWLV